MKRAYWENMAPSYGEEIFDVLYHDKKGLIRQVISKQAGPGKTVIDIGCAIGKWIPVLAPVFKKVIALDISAKNLAIARKLHSSYPNVDYLRADMSGKKKAAPAADFGICINAILTPHRKDRARFFAALGPCLKKGARLVLTVPSLESYLLTNIMQQQYRIDTRYFPKETSGKKALSKWNHIRQGITEIDDIPHKHYLKEELEHLLREAGFATERIHKLEYDWSTEFHKPPAELKKPGPWDWMVVSYKL
ncbi:MAG: methyltransferase domain-containing protein [Chitinophagaceae bacterium]|nr:methyltransferase domain-containing protein [Chitinophagaceae bacterium]